MIIAVSGGADSTALLLAIAALRQRRRGHFRSAQLTAVHVHHHLRESADEDARFVQDLCDRLEIDLDIEHIEVRNKRGNLSANARRARYGALRQAAERRGAGFVAVAHHADDQFETMLMALCRGASLRGLAGMEWCRSLGGGVRLVRPMLGVGRSACESLCRAAGIEWLEDPTNADARRTRARLRRDVMPVLEALWPGAAERAAGARGALAAAARALDRRIARAFGDASRRSWDRAVLAGLPPALVAGGLRRAALSANDAIADELGQDQLLRAARGIADDVRRPRTFHWPAGLRLRVTSSTVSITNSSHDHE
jgi:tRNA(Ile)-lysidine synthetase-like protein